VDVPVVAAAVDVDVAEGRFGGAGGVVAGDVEQPQDGLGGVPLLAQGRLRPLDGLTGQFPVGVPPVGVADHGDDAVLAVAGRQVAGDLGGQVPGRHAYIILTGFDLLLGGGGAGGVAGRGGLDGGVDGVPCVRRFLGSPVGLLRLAGAGLEGP